MSLSSSSSLTAASASASGDTKGSLRDYFMNAPTQMVDIEACEIGTPINGTTWIVQKSSSNGKRYFFNTATKTSRWRKPEELMTVRERLLAPCPWEEHTSNEGKKYYYNEKTKESLWTMPPEYRECLDKAAAAESDLQAFIQREEEEAERKRRQELQQQQQQRINRRMNRDEAIRLFKEMLSERFTSTATWDRVSKEAADDPRFVALRSYNERKHVFAEWIDRQRDVEVEKRIERIRGVKNDFLALLEERYTASAGTDYALVKLLIADDPRYKALAALAGESVSAASTDFEREQAALFDEFMVRKRFREAKMLLERKEEETAVLRAKFRADGRIAVDTPWRDVRDEYLEDPLFMQLGAADVLRAYEIHMQELEGAARATRERRDAKAARECRKTRDAFRGLLEERQRAGEIDMDTKWEGFAQKVAGDPRLAAFEDREAYWGSRPQDLLADVTGRLQSVYEEDEKVIYKTLDRIEEDSGGKTFFVFRLASTLDDFTAFFAENGRKEVLTRLRNPASLTFFFNYNMKCLFEKRAKLIRTLAKLGKDLGIGGEGEKPLSFEDAAAKVLAGHSAFDSKTLSLEDKKAVYEEFMTDPQKVIASIPPEIKSGSGSSSGDKRRKEETKVEKEIAPPELKKQKIEEKKDIKSDEKVDGSGRDDNNEKDSRKRSKSRHGHHHDRHRSHSRSHHHHHSSNSDKDSKRHHHTK